MKWFGGRKAAPKATPPTRDSDQVGTSSLIKTP